MFASFNQTVARAVIGATGATLCATVCLLGATAPAHAATVDAVPTRIVSYADLDMTRAEGRATLESRIRIAARAVCPAGNRSSQELLKQGACVKSNVETGMQTAIARTQVASR